MLRRISGFAATLSVCSAILCAVGSLPVHASDYVAEGDMQKYCQGRVAEQYHVNPRDITTLPTEHDDGYTVYGQFPPDGADPTIFECHFGWNGKWKRVVITSEAAPSYSSEQEAVSENDMPRYCMGEASAALEVRPQDILTLPVERDPGGYVVYGQYPPDGSDITTFECHFNGTGVFQTVYAN